MYFVRINGEKHSAWTHKSSAENQKRVLIEHGYKLVTIEYISGADYPDGHYFV